MPWAPGTTRLAGSGSCRPLTAAGRRPSGSECPHRRSGSTGDTGTGGGGGVKAGLSPWWAWGAGASAGGRTCCHSSMCQPGGQSNWLQACKAWGFSSAHPSAGAGGSPRCRQRTSRVWIPTPQVAEQGPQAPVCHLHRRTRGDVGRPDETTVSSLHTDAPRLSGTPGFTPSLQNPQPQHLPRCSQLRCRGTALRGTRGQGCGYRRCPRGGVRRGRRPMAPPRRLTYRRVLVPKPRFGFE